MGRTRVIVAMAPFLLLSAGGAGGASTKPARAVPGRPVRVSLILVGGGRVQGLLVRADAERVVLGGGGKLREIPIDRIEPASVYMVKRQVTDLSDAKAHVELGAFCLGHGLNRLAEREFAEALRMDGSLAGRIERARAAAAPAEAERAGLIEFRRPKVPEKDVRKFAPATPAQIKAHRAKAEDWARRTKAFTPTLHRVETAHFLIYSAWRRSNDKPLGEVCEKTYAALCRQFDVAGSASVWSGKCPVYVFWEREPFERFCTEVYKKGEPKASGYCGWEGDGFVFIAMGPCRSRRWFYEVLVHEATHGFLSRYLTNRNVPSWVHEGLADYMAATLVTGAWAGKRYIIATKQAVRNEKPVAGVFEKVGLNTFDYGIAQSFVRFLIARDRAGFVRFIRLMKEGQSEAAAMKEAFGWTRQQFLREWRRAAARAVGR